MRALNTETKRSYHCWWRKRLNINECATATAVTMATQTSGAHVCKNDSTFDAFKCKHTQCAFINISGTEENVSNMLVSLYLE